MATEPQLGSLVTGQLDPGDGGPAECDHFRKPGQRLQGGRPRSLPPKPQVVPKPGFHVDLCSSGEIKTDVTIQFRLSKRETQIRSPTMEKQAQQEVNNVGLQTSLISCNVLSSSRPKMETFDPKRDRKNSKAALSACGRAVAWQPALDMLVGSLQCIQDAFRIRTIWMVQETCLSLPDLVEANMGTNRF